LRNGSEVVTAAASALNGTFDIASDISFALASTSAATHFAIGMRQ